MAENTLFFCLHVNWPLLPRFKLNIPKNSADGIEATKANLQSDKGNSLVKQEQFIRSVDRSDGLCEVSFYAHFNMAADFQFYQKKNKTTV